MKRFEKINSKEVGSKITRMMSKANNERPKFTDKLSVIM